MTSSEDLITEAQELIGPGEPVKAAGAFELKDNYKAITAGGLATSFLIPGGNKPLLAGAAAAANIEGSRQGTARAQGLTPRMLVAVTEESTHVFSMPSIGGHPGEELMRFERSSAEVRIKRFGLARRLNLKDTSSGQHVELTGSTARVSPDAGGDKAVLSELEGWASG